MSLTNQESRLVSYREELLSHEECRVIDETFAALFEAARTMNLKAAGDDRCAKVEAALIQFLIDSRS